MEQHVEHVNQKMLVILARPRGFCAGVDRAIEVVKQALLVFGSPVYVRHEIVHNDHVVQELKEKGVIFIDEIHQVPDGAVLIFSAHGVSLSVRKEAESRGLRVFDATCPLVTKVHLEVARMIAQGREIVMIGHAGHPEVVGTMGQSSFGMHLVEDVRDVENLVVRQPENLGLVTQTTLSVDDCREMVSALKSRFPSIVEPKNQDICYATQNRQDAVKRLAERCDLVLVIGSKASSNSRRLQEVARRAGCQSYMIGSEKELDPKWLYGKNCIGVTAGASAPERLLLGLIDLLKQLRDCSVIEQEGAEENMSFPLPKNLVIAAQGSKIPVFLEKQ